MKLILAIGLALGTYGVAQSIGTMGTNFVAPTIDGRANVYNPSVGEIIYDASDATFYGRNQTSSWIPFSGGSGGNPVGTVLTFAGSTCPAGYTPADGLPLSRTDYSDLFDVLGTSHGEGDGSTTFNSPDYRGRFLRGVDGSAGRDPDGRQAMNTGGNSGNNVGSVQGDSLRSHNHTFQFTSMGGDSVGGQYVDNSTNQGISSVMFITNNTGGNETRPLNAYVNFCIKY